PSPPCRTRPGCRPPPPATRTPPASRAAAPAGRPCPGASCGTSARDCAEDAVHQPAGVLRRVALREADGFVDRHFQRDRTFFELEDADAQDVPLQRAELLRGPVAGDGRDLLVQLVRPLGDLLGEPLRELVDLTLVVGAERLAGQVP